MDALQNIIVCVSVCVCACVFVCVRVCMCVCLSHLHGLTLRPPRVDRPQNKYYITPRWPTVDKHTESNVYKQLLGFVIYGPKNF